MVLLVMEMVCDIDQDIVDFQFNYDNKEIELVVLLLRFFNLFVNGFLGIVVGMVINILIYNLCEVNEVVQWFLVYFNVFYEELFEVCMECIKGLDFFGGVFIVGWQGIEDVYCIGCGLVMMCVVIDMEEDKKGCQCLVVIELFYMCNLDNFVIKIVDLVNFGCINGIVDICDDFLVCIGQCLVIVFKCDVQLCVVMNNLYKYMVLQDIFGCNMLVLVDNVLCILCLD